MFKSQKLVTIIAFKVKKKQVVCDFLPKIPLRSTSLLWENLCTQTDGDVWEDPPAASLVS